MSTVTVREDVLDGLRSRLRTLSRRRVDGVVTADDATDYLNQRGVRQVRNRLSYVNRAFSEFSPVGTVSSERPSARYRKITMWVY